MHPATSVVCYAVVVIAVGDVFAGLAGRKQGLKDRLIVHYDNLEENTDRAVRRTERQRKKE